MPDTALAPSDATIRDAIDADLKETHALLVLARMALAGKDTPPHRAHVASLLEHFDDLLDLCLEMDR